MLGPLLEVAMSKKWTPFVARSTFRSENAESTPCSDHFWKLRCRKSARRRGAKHISKWKYTKHHMFAPLLEVQMSFRVAGARDCAPCPKWAKREGFVAFPKTMAGVGHLKRICKDAFSVAGAVQKTWSCEMLGGQGAHFLRGVALWSIRSVGLLRWFCVTGAAIDRWSGNIAKRIGTRLSALHFTFNFSRKSRRIALFLMLSSSKIEEVSQNCFVLEVVKFKNCRRLVELFRFCCCQRRKMRKSRRSASFSSWQIDRGIDRQTDRER